MIKLTIKRGSEVIAKIKDREVELTSEFSPEGQLVRSIVSLGVPTLSEVRQDRWRIQVEDPDFKDALSEHLTQYGLTTTE